MAHTLTSLKATEDALGVQVSPQTNVLRDLLYRGESIESHALHLFFLALPDYLNYPSAIAMAADHAEAVRLGLRLKKLGNAIQECIGGRAVHPVNPVPGGFGKLPSVDQLIALRNALQQGMEDCEAAVDVFASLPAADFCRANTMFAAVRPPRDYGYYSGDEIVVLSNGTRETVAAVDYRLLTNEKAIPHSHAKHSTYRGKPFMVGSLARFSASPERITGRAARVAGRLGLVAASGNPLDNNKAQAVELVFDVDHALATVERLLRDGLREERPVPIRPRAGAGVAVTEAPRGLLIHSYTYDDEGRIIAADVITPTALNAASVEERFRRTIEQSPDKAVPALTRKLEMVARAYDPCLSCSVHVVQKRHAG